MRPGSQGHASTCGTDNLPPFLRRLGPTDFFNCPLARRHTELSLCSQSASKQAVMLLAANLPRRIPPVPCLYVPPTTSRLKTSSVGQIPVGVPRRPGGGTQTPSFPPSQQGLVAACKNNPSLGAGVPFCPHCEAAPRPHLSLACLLSATLVS